MTTMLDQFTKIIQAELSTPLSDRDYLIDPTHQRPAFDINLAKRLVEATADIAGVSITLDDALKLETTASGHSDYTRTLALELTALASRSTANKHA